jgi:ribonuclease J
VAAGKIYFDARPEVVGAEVVRQRRQLAEEGVVVVFIPAPEREGEIIVVARGVAVEEEALVREVRRAAQGVLARVNSEERADVDWLRSEVALAAKRACRRSLGLRPVIVPVVA